MSMELELTFLELMHALESGTPEEQLAIGYRLAVAAYVDSWTARQLQDLLYDLDLDRRRQVEACLPVRYFFTPNELAFAIRMESFPQPEPVLAVMQDDREGFRPQSGLTPIDIAALPNELQERLDQVGQAYLFQCASPQYQGDEPILISEAVGEFEVEIYHIQPDKSFACIFREDFCLK